MLRTRKLTQIFCNLIFFSIVVLHAIPGNCEVRKIVSLAPVATEVVYALGAESRLIGVTDSCSLKEGQTVRRLGVYSAISPEVVYSLKPDLVVLTEGSENQAKMFIDLGLQVFEVKTSSLKNVQGSILELSKVLGLGKVGNSILNESSIKLDKLKLHDGSQIKTILILFGDEGSHFSAESYYGIGESTFYDDLVRVLKLENALKQKGYNVMSLEGVCTIKADCVILATDSLNKDKAIQTCFKKAKFLKVPKSPFLYPGIKYPEIAKSIARCGAE